MAWLTGGAIATVLSHRAGSLALRLRIVRPLLPDGLDRLALRRLRVGRAAVDLNFQRGAHGTRVEVLKVDGDLEVQVDKGELH